MSMLTVLDTREGKLLEQLKARLRMSAAGETEMAAGISLSGQAALENGVRPDIVLVSPKAGINPSKLPYCYCGLLLAPDVLSDYSRLNAERVVSYGMSPKDSVTLSSIDGSSIMLTIQREAPTLAGTVLERQELPATRLMGESPDEALACAAALLLLGFSPESLT